MPQTHRGMIFSVKSLLLTDAVLIVAAYGSSRLAQRIWKGEGGWNEAASLRTGDGVNETRLRVACASLATAIGVDSLVACGVLALIAGTLGRSFIAAIILVLSGLAGVAFLVFAGISVVIFFLERPQGLIPPPLRSRPPRTGANMQ